jgi:hypothetical protein
MRRESAEQDLRGAVERMIDEAQKKGVFDDLPGKGKPLQLGKNRHAGERALAFNLLQNNNYTLPWIAARQEILSAVYTFRGELAESWIAYQHELDAATGDEELQQASERWQAEKDRLLAELREINQTISALNLTIPVERLEVLKLHWQNELDRLGAND